MRLLLSFVEWALNPNGRLLVLSTTAEPLLHKRVHLTVSISSLRIHSQAENIGDSCLQGLAVTMKATMEGGHLLFVPAEFLHVLESKHAYAVSSAAVFHCLVLGHDQLLEQ